MMKTNSIVVKDGKKFDLNGLPISLRGTTAYANVYYGIDDGRRDAVDVPSVFIALVGLNDEERKLAGKSTFLFHLSKHDNVLAAAYVAHQFNSNREANIDQLKNTRTGEWDAGIIPNFEYTAIEAPTPSLNTGKFMKHSVSRKAKTAAIITVDNRLANDHFDLLCAKVNMQDLARKFDRDTVVIARNCLTINEFEMRFGL